MKNQITFSQAVNGYMLHANARHLSSHTIADYTNTFRKFQAFLDSDPPIAEIAADQVRAFLASPQPQQQDSAQLPHRAFCAMDLGLLRGPCRGAYLAKSKPAKA